jgi:hypothetical protein
MEYSDKERIDKYLEDENTDPVKTFWILGLSVKPSPDLNEGDAILRAGRAYVAGLIAKHTGRLDVSMMKGAPSQRPDVRGLKLYNQTLIDIGDMTQNFKKITRDEKSLIVARYERWAVEEILKSGYVMSALRRRDMGRNVGY